MDNRTLAEEPEIYEAQATSAFLSLASSCLMAPPL